MQASKLFIDFLKLKSQYIDYIKFISNKALSSKLFETTQSIGEKRFDHQNRVICRPYRIGCCKTSGTPRSIPKLQDIVQGLRYNLQDMQYRKQGLERYLKAIQQRINELTDSQNMLQQTFDLAAEKVSNLYKGECWLEQSIYCQPQK